MESLTHKEFRKQVGKVILILTVFMLIFGYKIFISANKTDYVIIVIISILGVWCVRELLLFGDAKMSGEDYRMSSSKLSIIEFILMIGLGGLSIYVFASKGLYGLYKLIDNFNLYDLLYRLLAIYISYKLVAALSKLQTAFNLLKYNEYTSSGKIEENLFDD